MWPTIWWKTSSERSQIPFGVAVNFLINGKDYLIPMATEEPSVIAAASNMARLVRKAGGFHTSGTGPLMRAQIQALGVADPEAARLRVLGAREELLASASAIDPMLVKFGGGAKDLEVHIIHTEVGVMVVTHLIVDTRDAMGANAVNSMAESLAPRIAELTGGQVRLRILSNLADRRLARCWAKINKEDIGGEAVVDGIVEACAFAAADPYRAATHNKGIMNGITAAVMASGNDTRAIESGAHAYAARNGSYTSLTAWENDRDGNLTAASNFPWPWALSAARPRFIQSPESRSRSSAFRARTNSGRFSPLSACPKTWLAARPEHGRHPARAHVSSCPYAGPLPPEPQAIWWTGLPPCS